MSKPVENGGESPSALIWADRAAASLGTVALGAGLVQRGSEFIYKRSFAPLAGQIASHRAFGVAAPIGLGVMAYNAVRSVQRLLTGTSEDRWADGMMIGGALCGGLSILGGVVPLFGRYGKWVRGIAATAGLVLDSADLIHVGWRWQAGQVSTGDLLLQAGLTLVFGFDRESRAAISSLGRWKIDTNSFVHPEWARHLPQILYDPTAVAPHRQLDEATMAVINGFARSYTTEVTERWSRHGRFFSPEEDLELFMTIREQLAACVRLGAIDLPNLMEADITVFRFSWGEASQIKFDNPLEEAIAHFYGVLTNFARWGKAGLYPLHRSTLQDLPFQTYRRPVTEDGTFYLKYGPGNAESYGGVSCSLVWKPVGWTHEFRIMTVSSIRRPSGYAIVQVQGGKGIGREKIKPAPDQKPVKIMDHARSVIDPDLEGWLLRQVLRQLQQEDPTAPLLFRKGIRQLFLYDLLQGTDGKTLRDLAGRTDEWTLQRGMGQNLNRLESEVADLDRRHPLTQAEVSRRDELMEQLVKARRASRIVHRFNRLALRFGFKPELPQSPWAVIHPGSRAYKELRRHRPTDLASVNPNSLMTKLRAVQDPQRPFFDGGYHSFPGKNPGDPLTDAEFAHLIVERTANLGGMLKGDAQRSARARGEFDFTTAYQHGTFSDNPVYYRYAVALHAMLQEIKPLGIRVDVADVARMREAQEIVAKTLEAAPLEWKNRFNPQ